MYGLVIHYLLILLMHYYVLQIEEILRDYGVVCVSRVGSNPEQFIYNSDILYKHQVRLRWIHTRLDYELKNVLWADFINC